MIFPADFALFPYSSRRPSQELRKDTALRLLRRRGIPGGLARRCGWGRPGSLSPNLLGSHKLLSSLEPDIIVINPTANLAKLLGIVGVRSRS